LFEHDLFGKPVSTFPDHALDRDGFRGDDAIGPDPARWPPDRSVAEADTTTDVAFPDGKVTAVGSELKAGPGTDIRDVAGHIVTPGLIDLHTHVYWGGTSLCIDAEEFCQYLRRHYVGRHRQCRPRQFCRLPQARDRAEPGVLEHWNKQASTLISTTHWMS
jgi:hypothetical protein